MLSPSSTSLRARPRSTDGAAARGLLEGRAGILLDTRLPRAQHAAEAVGAWASGCEGLSCCLTRRLSASQC